MENNAIRERVIAMATENIGVIEDFDNITKYNEWYGHGMNGDGKKGQPWCASFVSYIYNFTDAPMGKIDHEEGFCYVPTLVSKAKAHGWITKEPKAGDIVCFDWQLDGKADHTGIFVKWIDATTFETIEGNTSPTNKGSQSNGGMVCKKVRDVRFATFVNLIDNVE